VGTIEYRCIKHVHTIQVSGLAAGLSDGPIGANTWAR
jgi:hypothetical protein